MRDYKTFKDFWPYYLREHEQPTTRALHYVGTTLALCVLFYALLTQKWLWLIGFPVAGYFFAWISHAFVEKNKPATFTYPLWSLISDFKMYSLFLTGRLGPELEKAGVKTT